MTYQLTTRAQVNDLEADATDEVLVELVAATRKYEPFATDHEGYAVLLEELDELWDEIKKKKRDRTLMRAEAKQVAAMAIRFMVDRT